GVGDEGEGRGVALREAVVRKAPEAVEEGLGPVAGVAAGEAALDEALTVGEDQLLGPLVRDRAPQPIGFSGGEARGHHGELHRLLLEERDRSEEHTSELQSRENLVCRLLLEK